MLPVLAVPGGPAAVGGDPDPLPDACKQPRVAGSSARMSQLRAEDFAENARAALRDPVLTGALRRATDTFAERRTGAIVNGVGASLFTVRIDSDQRNRL